MAWGLSLSLANLDAEQALLGAILFDNAALDMLGVEVRPEHFAEPIHAVLFDTCVSLIRSGHLADPITVWGKVQGQFADFESGFMFELVDKAPPAANAKDYAHEVVAYALRRDLAKLGDWLDGVTRNAAEEPEAILQETERQLLGLRVQSRRTRPISASEGVDAVFDDLASEAKTGVRTGISNLDKHLGPMLPGDLIIACGRPGAGKSAWAGCVATNVALEQGLGVLEISLEMSVEQLYRRRLCDVAHRIKPSLAPDYRDLRRKQVSIEQQRLLHEAGEIIRKLPIVSVARTGVTPDLVLSIARRQIAEWAKAGIKAGLLVVDHWGLMIGDGKGRYEQQTNIAIRGKEAAVELQLPYVALAQLSRKVEERDDKRPILSDLRDSGALEENADVVCGFFRDAYYAEQEPEPKKELAWATWNERRNSKDIEALLLKVREGRRGTVRLWGDMGRNAIRDAAPQDDFFN